LLQDGCDALEVLGWSIGGCDLQTAPASDSAAPQTDFPV
jgi:hypothetical protein